MSSPLPEIFNSSPLFKDAETGSIEAFPEKYRGRSVTNYRIKAGLDFTGTVLATCAAVAFFALTLFCFYKHIAYSVVGLSTMIRGASFLPGLGYSALWGGATITALGAMIVSVIAATALFSEGTKTLNKASMLMHVKSQ